MAVPDYESKVEWFAEQFTVRELLGLLADADFAALYKKARDMAGSDEDEPVYTGSLGVECETNACEEHECHRCFPRTNCPHHEKCGEFTRDGTSTADEEFADDEEFFDDPNGAICGECGERSNDPNHAANCTPTKDYISLQAAGKRAGTPHEEIIRIDRPWCEECGGFVDQGEPDREFHPERYFEDDAPAEEN